MATNQDLATQLFSMLEIAFFGANTGDSGKGLFVMCWPGIFVPMGPESSTAQLYYQTQIADRCLNAGFLANASQTYKQNLGTLSDWYNFALTMSMLAQQQLSAAQQAKVTADMTTKNAYEKNPTFMILQAQYEAAKEAKDNAANSDDYALAKQNYVKVRNQYMSSGGAQYEAAIDSLIIILGNANPDVLFVDYQNQVTLAQMQDKKFGTFNPTYFSPTADTWQSGSWTHAKFTADQWSQTATSHSTSWGVGGGVNFGLWSFGGGSAGSSSANHQASQDQAVSVELECMRIGILRPWIHDVIFTLRNWTWDPDSFGSVSGDQPFSLAYYPPGATQPDPTSSKMPVIIQELIAVRNVTLEGNFDQSTIDKANSSFQANASFGWGPFSVSGSYSTSDSSYNAQGSASGDKITIITPQILGMFVSVLPQCPNPDPNFAWQKPLPPLHA
jgi:hypothetical protein